ncbi:NAD-dependent protein deacetylase sirtuin-2 [Dimargaris verticillata]|uniref:NAD-dependent protein deacetylase sirtuin-2 n=1 Tax=Dimargaris verticillata TaxID=2761393 RepID=A0A9W8ED61_9FUNG|nr:NAD-dependent protein deacetylase sirtuin-2 [Dimargaris verticillata]
MPSEPTTPGPPSPVKDTTPATPENPPSPTLDVVNTDSDTDHATEPSDGSTAVSPPSPKPSRLPHSVPPKQSGRRPAPNVREPMSPLQTRLLHPRWAILSDNTLSAVARYVSHHDVRNIIVMSGAGISTSAGIPDFRSPGTGLYDNLSKFNLPYAEAIFDIDYFRRCPRAFYALAKELYPGNFKPTLSHYFVRLLAEKKRLLRNFTQNIDTLERVAGIDPELLVEAHGSFHTAHCIRRECRQEYSQQWVKDRILTGNMPLCTTCHGKDAYVKPDITFFGEALPSRFFTQMQRDFSRCDLLIVMGTSLQVEPFASLIEEVSLKTPRLLINLEKCRTGPLAGKTGFDFDGSWHKYRRDALHLGTCDEGCLQLAELLGWKEDLLSLHGSEHRQLDGSPKKQVPVAPLSPDGRRASVGIDEIVAEVAEKLTLSEKP